MDKPTPFGLGATASNGQVLFLPLQSVTVEAHIFDGTYTICAFACRPSNSMPSKWLHSFNSSNNMSIRPGNGQLSSAQYVFPTPGNAAVCAFKMENSDGRVVSGVVKESEEAKQDFQDAVDEGKWAGVAYEITADGKQI